MQLEREETEKLNELEPNEIWSNVFEEPTLVLVGQQVKNHCF